MSHTSSNNGCYELLFPLDRVKLYIYFFLTLLISLGGVGTFIYYLKKGQFDDLEDVKYQMFRDEE